MLAITVHVEGGEIETDDFACRTVNDVDARPVGRVCVWVARWLHRAFFGGQWLLTCFREEKSEYMYVMINTRLQKNGDHKF